MPEASHRPFASLEEALAAPALPPIGLLAVLPRGETFRNFVYTGALERVDAAVGAGVLSVYPSDETVGLLAERFPFVAPLESVPDARVVNVVREVLDLAHGRWLWSAAAKDRWLRREVDVATARKRRRYRAKKWIARAFATDARIGRLARFERWLSRKCLKSDVYLRLLERLRPRVVFNASHVHSTNAIQAVQAAQWLGIHTATFIFSWDNLTSQGRILLPYDTYLVWNEQLKTDLLAMYPTVDPAQVHVTGTPQFDSHFDPAHEQTREAYCNAVGADPARLIVLYTTGMPNHMPGEPLVVEGIADLLREPPLADKNAQLLVRVYPKDVTDRFAPLKTRRKDILFPDIPWERVGLTPLPADTTLWTNMVRHAAVGINVASTVSLELMMFDKPVINVAYDPPDINEHLPYARYYGFDHYKPVVDSGALSLARSRDEMRTLLERAFANPAAEAEQRKTLLARMFGRTLDGKSAERVASVLQTLAT